MFIESPANEKVRKWRKLKNKKGRKEQQLFLVEGLRLVEELLQSSWEPVYLLWDVGTDEVPERILTRAKERNTVIVEMSPAAFAAVSDTVTPQGVIVIAALPPTSPAYPEHVLLLDEVQDPGNAGTLLRAAEAFGLEEVVCTTGTVDPFAPKVVRSTMGGLFHLRVQAIDALPYIHTWSETWPDGQVISTQAVGANHCYVADFTKPTLLIIGSEATGVSEKLIEASDDTVQIPMAGQAESLNAAMAGSILMYEMLRQRLNR
ncbi:RNA methyltransferase [Alicyclobacillus sp. SO9]|uniref:TrmH family RNA methyltransferase n=1 Tax=Alicyclobacillus sp. SO9 TaxID=2665646 RepID=UPI0018E7674F|nr:RNA methyltransferase [Alicyclobacillus sp. SO9]QQE77624.1 RNA methyltransferase [Alicyclobacillus sp. SO9]